MAENDNPILLPYPRSLTRSAGQHVLLPGQRIILEGVVAQELMTAGRRLQTQLGKLADLDWEISATPLGPAEEIGAVLRLAAGTADHEQGYRLTISPEQILIEAPEPAGVFYGVCTLVQTCSAIWPDAACRADSGLARFCGPRRHAGHQPRQSAARWTRFTAWSICWPAGKSTRCSSTPSTPSPIASTATSGSRLRR